MEHSQDAPAPVVTRLKADELNDLFVMFAAQDGLARAKETLKQRLETIPNGNENLETVCETLDKLTDALVDTIPTVKRQQLYRNLRNMKYVIHFVPPVTLPKDQMIAFSEDVDALTVAAVENKCLLCTDNCNKCKLGKALDHLMLTTRARDESWGFVTIERQEG